MAIWSVESWASEAARAASAVLDAQRTLATAEAALAASEAQLSTDQIAIFLALGGGWTP